MNDRIDEALRAFRDATEDARPPAGLAEAIVRSVEAPSVADALAAVGRRGLWLAAAILVVLVLSAVGSLRSLAGLEERAADYTLSRGPS